MPERAKVNILLVDDQPGKLLSLEAVLAELDENVLKASSADEALHHLLARDIAVVLVDVCMPKMDGFELAELIRQHPRFHRTAIIFISAVHLSDRDRLRGYQLGAVDYIPVPIVPEVLRAKVAIFAELHRKTEQLYSLNQELEQRVALRTADLEASAERLRESEQRYRHLVHALPVAVYTCDHSGRITLFNEAAAKLWGAVPPPGADLESAGWRVFRFDGTPLPPEECPTAIALRTGRIVRGVEIIFERPDGSRRTVLPHPELLRDASGRITGVINMLTDVTDTRSAEQAQALLAEIVSSSEDAIVSATLDGVITSWNHGAERMLGYTAQEVIGGPVFKLIPPERSLEEFQIIERLRRGERVQAFETVRLAKDGSPITASLTVSPVRDPYGQMVGISKVIRDITEQKKAEQVLKRDRETLERLIAERTHELEVSAKRLRLADRMATIGTLSAGLGHDMGNLLLPIRMRLDTIEASDVPPEVREDVLAIRRAAEYLQRLADSLRLLALDPDQAAALGASTDLTRWWAEAEGMIRNGVPRHVNLTFHAEPDLPEVAIGRPALTQLIFNLVQNAGDALRRRAAGNVAVTAARAPDGAGVQIQVRDDGPGMSEQTRRHCLEPFFTTKTRELSTGLGLALVTSLIQKVGGTISIDSEIDQGTSVTLQLRAAPGTASATDGQCQTRPTAVVTLRDPRLRAHVDSILTSLDFEIAESGLDSADLWVTDQPGEDGRQAARRFVLNRPHSRALLFATGAPRPGDDGRVATLEPGLAPSALRSRIHGLLATPV